LWLKADAITGVADGAKLATWVDSSGNGQDATQPTEANQPTYMASGRNGLPTVKFDDLDADSTPNGVQFMNSSAAIQTKAGASFTAFAVFRTDDTGITGSALEGRDNLLQPLDVDTSNLGRTVLFLDTSSGVHKLRSVSAQGAMVAQSDYTPGSWGMATILQDASASTLSLFVDGAPDQTVPIGAEGGQNGGWRLGATKQGHGGLKGQFAEILVYDRALTSAERQQAERYLAKKWSLPASTTQTFAMRAVTVGNAAVDITDSAGLLLPADITTVFVAGTTLVLNPSFELDKDSGVGTAPVTGWAIGGGNVGMAENANPFLSVEDLTIPDRRKVLRIQNSGSISQTIKGLRPGQLYGLQFFYNRRSSGYSPDIDLSLQVNFAGQELAKYDALVPAAMNGLTDYYFQELRFTPTAASELLEFKTTASGDATLFLDAVSIIPRLTVEIAVMNSRFEGSAMGANWPGYLQPDRVAGWICGGGGYGVNAYSPKTFFVEPFLDNGINSDQDNAFFGQGGVTMKPTVAGLTAGQRYTLVVDYNCRDGRGQGSNLDPQPGQMDVSFEGASVLTTPEFPPVDTIKPWPGFRHTLPFYQAFVPITPSADTAELIIAHVGVVGDETLLVENVRIVPGARTPPSITKGLDDQAVTAGTKVTFAVMAAGTPPLGYRWYEDGVPLADGNGLSGTTTSTLTINAAATANAGTYSVLVTDGVGVVGSAAALAVEAAADVILGVGVDSGQVLLSWPTAATGFRLQHAPALPANGTWQDEPAPAVQNGPNWEVRISPTAAQRFYRLTQ
jgi:hypothetical protein